MILLFSALLVVLSVLSPAYGAQKGAEALLPATCAAGWSMDGKPATYTPATLYKYIDGEAELYLPYGFGQASTVMYARPGEKGGGMVASIFRMGSLLDAFGIYASYRGPASTAAVGAEGFAEESQLMFYQDRYFVRIEASGAVSPGGAPLQSCADAISSGLPQSRAKPPQLEWLKVDGAVPFTDRYYPSGLLGYGFFGRGLTVEADLKGRRVKCFIVMAQSADAAGRTLADYEKYLKGSGVTPEVKDGVLHAVDPLFKGTVVRRSGPFLAGVNGLADAHDGDALSAQLARRVPAQ